MLSKRYLKNKNEVEVTFEFENTEVDSVALVCDAQNWEPIAMSRRRKDGTFYAKVRFPSNGAVQFRYLLDGERWENDAAADAYWPNEFGGDNSVAFTQPENAA